MSYQVRDLVTYYVKRCACVGGGSTELQGMIIGIIDGWYQISSSSGIHYVKLDDILSHTTVA